MKRLKSQSRTPTPKFAKVVSTFDDHACYSWPECQAVLRFFNLPDQAFLDWMVGQTCPMLPDGKIGVYWYDLNRYIRWKVGNVTPVFD